MCLTFGEGGGGLGKVRHVSLLARFFILDGPLLLPVCQCGLAVVHMSNDGHVPNVFLFVHTFSDLVYREIDLKRKFKGLNVNLNFIFYSFINWAKNPNGLGFPR